MSSPYVLKNCKLYLGAFDLSGDMNKLAIASEREAKEKTVFGCATKISSPGLFNVGMAHEGFYEAGIDKVDKVLWDKFALSDEIMTICPTDGSSGEPAFSCKTLESNYSPAGSVGEMFAFKVDAKGTGDLVRATIMENGAKTVTGNGVARNLGAVSATQKLYGVMHILAVSGTTPTLDMKIQSDDAEGFASPIDRITFTQATAKGAQWATPVAGPITDTWWRCSYTIGGTSPSFTVVVIIGIQ